MQSGDLDEELDDRIQRDHLIQVLFRCVGYIWLPSNLLYMLFLPLFNIALIRKISRNFQFIVAVCGMIFMALISWESVGYNVSGLVLLGFQAFFFHIIVLLSDAISPVGTSKEYVRFKQLFIGIEVAISAFY